MSNYELEDFTAAKLKGTDYLLTTWVMHPHPHRVPRSFESWKAEHEFNDKLLAPLIDWRRSKYE